MLDVRFRGGRLIRFILLLALAALAQAWQQTCAQNVGPLELTFMLHGGATFNYVNGTGWKGIVGDSVDAGYPWMKEWPTFFTRANNHVVCARRCPDTIHRYDDSPQDKMVWKEGPPTVGGRIGVRCGQYHYCAVYQDGKPAHPNAESGGDWHQVSYVELAAPAKP